MRWERARAYPWVLAALSGLLFFARADMPLTDGDSALYGLVARNVLSTGDWIVMTARGWLLDKPPLTVWLTAIGIQLFGATPFALRWWHSLTAVGLVLMTYAISRLFYEPRTSFWAGAITATSVLVWYCGIVPQQDVPAAVFAVVSLYGLVAYLERGSRAAFYLIWVGAALCALTRAFAGLVLPVGVALAYLALHRLRRRPRPRLRPGNGPCPAVKGAARGLARVHLVAGPALFAAIACPWFVLGYLRLGYGFLDYHLFSGNARFFSSPSGTSGFLHFWSYAPLLVASFLPWSGTMFHAILRAVRSFVRVFPGPAAREAWRRVRGLLGPERSPSRPGPGSPDAAEHVGDAFFLVWFVAAFALPFPMKWRVIRYLLPSIPPLAALTARSIAPLLEGAPSQTDPARARELRLAATVSSLVVAPLVLAMVLVIAGRFPEEQSRYLAVVAIPLGGLGASLVAFAVLSFLGRCRSALHVLLGLTALTYLLTFCAAASRWETIAPWRTMSRIIDEAAAGSLPVLAVDVPRDELVFLDYYASESIIIGDARACGERIASERLPFVAIVGQSAAESVREASLSAGASVEKAFSAPSGTHVLKLSFAGRD